MFRLEELLNERYPALARAPASVSGPALSLLRRLVREAEINRFLESCAGCDGFEFVDRVLEHFEFGYSVVARELERIPSEGRVLIVANHPLGVLDGIALLRLVGQVRRDVRIVANDVLMHFEPMRPLLLPVANLGGRFNRANVVAIRAALEADEAVIMFPSGEVSRAGPRGIRDRRWQSGFLKLAEHARAPLLPVHVDGRNSALFYGVSALFRPLSALMLLREPHGQRHRTLPIRIGGLIPWRAVESLDLPRDKKIETISRAVYVLRRGIAASPAVQTEAPIAHPEDRLLLRRELGASELLGTTADGKQIRLFEAPGNSALLRELGRLREIAFRQVGEGTGRRRDIDSFDAHYRHVVLWDDVNLQVAGAYRLAEAGRVSRERGPLGLYTAGLFQYGRPFLELLPQSVELGRSFVHPRYQGLRALDYLWQGIGAYLRRNPGMRYLFGPVSLSAAMPEAARKMLVYFFERHYGGEPGMVRPLMPYRVADAEREALAGQFPGRDLAAETRLLKQRLAGHGVAIPVLYKQYAELCEPGGTRFLGFSVDPAFGHCVDGLVLVDLEKLKATKRERYLGPALPEEAAIHQAA